MKIRFASSLLIRSPVQSGSAVDIILGRPRDTAAHNRALRCMECGRIVWRASGIEQCPRSLRQRRIQCQCTAAVDPTAKRNREREVDAPPSAASRPILCSPGNECRAIEPGVERSQYWRSWGCRRGLRGHSFNRPFLQGSTHHTAIYLQPPTRVAQFCTNDSDFSDAPALRPHGSALQPIRPPH